MKTLNKFLHWLFYRKVVVVYDPVYVSRSVLEEFEKFSLPYIEAIFIGVYDFPGKFEIIELDKLHRPEYNEIKKRLESI